jgi:hypothetical protein
MPGYVSELEAGPPAPGQITDAPTAAPLPATASVIRDSRQRELPPERHYRGGPSISVGFKTRSASGG